MQKLSTLRTTVLLWMFFLAPLYAQEHVTPRVRLPPDGLSREESRAVHLYREVLPTVVTILASKLVLTAEGPRRQESLGSGVLVFPEAHVLTAAHVVANAEAIDVKTHDGRSRPAELIYSQSGADIALLKLLTPAPELKHATLGDSDRLAVGQRAYVTGSPFGLENSFSVGHISGFREFGRLYDGTILAEYIQIDAAINSGNSGGPVFNSKGEVIGITSRILTHAGGFEGVGFVVAINTAKQLLAFEDRPWIGIEGIFLSSQELARLLNLDLEGGLLIQRVARGSPADKAGLRGGSIPARILNREVLLGGDLILEFNDQEACHGRCLAREGPRLAGIDEIHVKFLRGGKVLQTTVDVSNTRGNFLEGADRE